MKRFLREFAMMNALARPTMWTYDQPLFRAAVSDEERLEAMLAAIALPDEGLWVVERAGRPRAFAWGVFENRRLRIVHLFVRSQDDSPTLLAPLVERLRREATGRADWITIPEDAVEGTPAARLANFGLCSLDGVWSMPLID